MAEACFPPHAFSDPAAEPLPLSYPLPPYPLPFMAPSAPLVPSCPLSPFDCRFVALFCLSHPTPSFPGYPSSPALPQPPRIPPHINATDAPYMRHSALAPLRAVTTPGMFHVKHLRSNTLRRCCSLFCEMDTLPPSRLSFELKELGIWEYHSGAKQSFKAPDVSRETFLHSTSLSLRIKFSLSHRITVSFNNTPSISMSIAN